MGFGLWCSENRWILKKTDMLSLVNGCSGFLVIILAGNSYYFIITCHRVSVLSIIAGASIWELQSHSDVLK